MRAAESSEATLSRPAPLSRQAGREGVRQPLLERQSATAVFPALIHGKPGQAGGRYREWMSLYVAEIGNLRADSLREEHSRVLHREAFTSSRHSENTCVLCQARSTLVSATLGICGDCIRARPDEAARIVATVHQETRRAFELPGSPPRTAGGVECPLCSRACLMGEGE